MPFGLCSSPKIFTAVADTAEWIAHSTVIWWIGHYLDNFLLTGRPNWKECQLALEQLSELFQQLGVPVAQASKTDPFHLGVSIYLGKAHSDACPVAAILAYAAQRGQTSGPFFRFTGGHPLTRAHFVEAVQSALRALGMAADHYAGHSFRIGAATTAAAKGVPDSFIKTLGCWNVQRIQCTSTLHGSRFVQCCKLCVRD